MESSSHSLWGSWVYLFAESRPSEESNPNRFYGYTSQCKSNCENLNKLYKFYAGLVLAQNTKSKLACANYANPAFTAFTGGTFLAMNKPTFML